MMAVADKPTPEEGWRPSPVSMLVGQTHSTSPGPGGGTVCGCEPGADLLFPSASNRPPVLSRGRDWWGVVWQTTNIVCQTDTPSTKPQTAEKPVEEPGFVGLCQVSLTQPFFVVPRHLNSFLSAGRRSSPNILLYLHALPHSKIHRFICPRNILLLVPLSYIRTGA